MKKHFRVIFSNFGRISCDFWLDVRDFGKKCEIKGNKEKSRESGGSRQGKQPWGVGRYAPPLTVITMMKTQSTTVLYCTAYSSVLSLCPFLAVCLQSVKYSAISALLQVLHPSPWCGLHCEGLLNAAECVPVGLQTVHKFLRVTGDHFVFCLSKMSLCV